MRVKLASYLWQSDSDWHLIFDFRGLERRYWNRNLDIWIETIDVFCDEFIDSNSNMASLALMVPRGNSHMLSVEQVQFPEFLAFVYDEAEL
jgi:hypothetical protein